MLHIDNSVDDKLPFRQHTCPTQPSSGSSAVVVEWRIFLPWTSSLTPGQGGLLFCKDLRVPPVHVSQQSAWQQGTHRRRNMRAREVIYWRIELSHFSLRERRYPSITWKDRLMIWSHIYLRQGCLKICRTS